MKLSSLPPSMRENKRYIVFEIFAQGEIEFEELSKAIWRDSIRLLGELDVAISRIWPIEDLFNKERKIAVLRVNHNFVEKFKAVLALIKEIGNKKVAIKILGVTGTIKSAKERFLKA